MTEDGDVRMTLLEVEELSFRALAAHQTSERNARCMARSIAAAEAEGLRSHGLLRLPTYCAQAAIGKIDGHAVPSFTASRPGVLRVDACDGFAHPAIELGLSQLVPAARAQGTATLAITRSYNCGVVGHHVEQLANEGLVALAFANTPSAIAAWGGRKPLFGTNPIAFAAPRANGAPLVIDQSSSAVARGEVVLRASQGKSIPEGWALDSEGAPTTDPQAALKGSMLPAGGYKGAGFALMVEVLAAVLTGASLSFEAPSFLNTEGGPPRTGQLFIALDPSAFAGGFAERIERVLEAMLADEGVRLPGTRRIAARAESAAHGIRLDRATYAGLAQLGAGTP